MAADRILQDRLCAADAPDEVTARVARLLAEAAELLKPFDGGPLGAIAGTRTDLPGRGHPFLPTYAVDEWSDNDVVGRVTFGRIYDSGGGAGHGGALPVLFVEILGRLANSNRINARTAYMHVDFRSGTPIGRELGFQAHVDRIEGRKRFVTGRITDGEVLVAEADGLFVEPRPA
ncbi:MAG: hypothetical protein JWM76_2628 [Pseudonocardiales bacterium]|nr:hypothetical protein [Pseudonocardiales bacterium]